MSNCGTRSRQSIRPPWLIYPSPLVIQKTPRRIKVFIRAIEVTVATVYLGDGKVLVEREAQGDHAEGLGESLDHSGAGE